MKKNMENADRIVRLIVAVIILALYFTGVISGTLGIILLVVAIIFVLTSSLGFCPLYWFFGIKPGSKKENDGTI